MTRANLVRFVLTAPADKAIFDRISAAYENFVPWCEDLREKKIDVAHELMTHTVLNTMERDIRERQALIDQSHADGERPAPISVYDQHLLRTQRIYFRALLLALLDAEDVWKDEQAAKARAKAAKENA